MRSRGDAAATFLRWMYLRSTFHRGYVLTALLYFVLVAHLPAARIVLLGTAMSLTLLFAGAPAGVWADTAGRRWPLVLGQLLLAAGMVMTGLVKTFLPLLITQVLWGPDRATRLRIAEGTPARPCALLR